ncbi:hypothetical protein B566_EDAN007129 [Ephemera danica]|nr:hypothetical protein B566_EDAN007129 [Ephemera danica]
MRVLLLLAPLLLLQVVMAKVYERCELARELRDRLRVPEEQLATWVCIAHRESMYNTSIVGTLAPAGKDHGLFQISDLFWCEKGDIGGACGLDCNSLLDDDIKDDFTCARRIYRAHQGLQGDGFRAWAVYAPHCSAGRHALEEIYTKDCFANTNAIQRRVLYHPAPLYWYYNVVHYVK